ncbi:ribosomal protein S9/S16-domain-containing protein [Favolaschia claudopus]|uniref:Ribosomal protein S9/S16-domain-containing protein n=1 Tax=Favolaschia claudopus TaxID=2862362 RepID=A0AAW0AAC1_9AGAR
MSCRMQGLLRASLAPVRRHAFRSPRRALATRGPFVPPLQQMQTGGIPMRQWPMEEDLEYEEEDPDSDSDEEVDKFGELIERGKPAPASPSFYSGRAAYYDQLAQVESAVNHTRSALKMLQLLPLPDFAREALPNRPAVWKTAKEMGADLQVSMTSSRYRAMTRLLGQLNEYYRIAFAAGCDDLALRTRNLLNIFESPAKTAALTRGRRKTLYTDQLGRSYTFGKRKTSTARVWMVPVALPSEELEVVDLEQVASLDEAAALLTSQPDRFHEPQLVPKSTILINNIPVGEYFAVPADRERVVRPLKMTGLLGAYNIFTLVRGGGSTGQSGALAHGIAKGLLVHNPDLGDLMRRTKLLRRDPRMVERKKPGRAKARKGYTWVKR